MIDGLDDFASDDVAFDDLETTPIGSRRCDRRVASSAAAIEREFVKEVEIAFRTAVMLSFRGAATVQNPKPGELMKYRVRSAQLS